MKPPNEQELLTGARKFDLQVLGAIYDQYSPGIYRYAIRLLGDPSTAEDCVSATFSRFLQTVKMGQGPDRYLQAYLYRIAHNWITDHYRRQPPPSVELDEKIDSGENSLPEHQVDTSLEKQQVLLAIRSLTPDQRQVVALRFFEGWANSEIAQALDKPIGAVKALQYRALQSLQSYLIKNEQQGKSNE